MILLECTTETCTILCFVMLLIIHYFMFYKCIEVRGSCRIQSLSQMHRNGNTFSLLHCGSAQKVGRGE